MASISSPLPLVYSLPGFKKRKSHYIYKKFVVSLLSQSCLFFSKDHLHVHFFLYVCVQTLILILHFPFLFSETVSAACRMLPANGVCVQDCVRAQTKQKHAPLPLRERMHSQTYCILIVTSFSTSRQYDLRKIWELIIDDTSYFVVISCVI